MVAESSVEFVRYRRSTCKFVFDVLCDRSATAFAKHNIRARSATPNTRLKDHLIGRRRLPARQRLPMRHAENVGVFASRIPALEREFQRIDSVPALMITVGASPVVASGHLRVEH